MVVSGGGGWGGPFGPAVNNDDDGPRRPRASLFIDTHHTITPPHEWNPSTTVAPCCGIFSIVGFVYLVRWAWLGFGGWLVWMIQWGEGR